METLESVQARHRKELKDLQSRITNKKKNATKKTRKGVNDECSELERQLRERQEQEIAVINGETPSNLHDEADEAPPEEDATTDTITTKIARVRFEEKEVTPPNVQEQQPEGGKKRNRQKERLARRAAEREADSARAETEAASMTDHRQAERENLEKAFQAAGRTEHDIAPDGHCLFAAVADQLGLQGIALESPDQQKEVAARPGYKQVRRAAADWMEGHEEDFAPFLAGEDEGGLQAYVAKMRDTAEWGGQLELLALASRYGVVIRVVQEGRTETIEPGGGGGVDGGTEKKEVWLAYYRHGYGLGEHYNSLRPAAG